MIETVSNAWTERLARAATVEMGGSALLAFYPMSGR
ncbi:S-methyl thiohydantoin desulfurase domain-containing protein [Rhizobium laguerreae]